MEIKHYLQNLHQYLSTTKIIFSSLEPNWDEDEPASPISAEALNLSVQFVEELAHEFLNKSYLMEDLELDPCRDGSVDLTWVDPDIRMLINFSEMDNGAIKVSLFAELKNDNQNFIKLVGTQKTYKIIIKSLCNWVTNKIMENF